MPTSERSLGRATDAAGVQTQVTRKNTDGADHSADQSHIPGGRNESSLTGDYLVTRNECNKTHFDPNATTEQVITNAPAHILGFVGKIGTGTLTLRDSATAVAAATPFPVYPLAVGSQVDFPGDVRMENGITAQCSVGTDEVTIFWRPL